jgi:hypothetical protein
MNCAEQSCLVSWDLDGRVRPIRRVLPATLAAQQAGVRRIIVPLRQAGEAKFVAGIDVFGIASIAQLVALLQGEPMPVVDPIEVIGDPGRQARQALSGPSRRGRAAGGQVGLRGRRCRQASHALHGPPGVGKTMLAERMNARAIALGLEALRKVDRYRITKRGERYTGWSALPPATPMGAAKMTADDALEFSRASADWNAGPDYDEPEQRPGLSSGGEAAAPGRRRVDQGLPEAARS